MILELALFCVFLIIVVAPSDGAVYVCPPLICEPACFMRKISVFGVAGNCKFFWGMELKNFGKFSDSRIVQTQFMSFFAVLLVLWGGVSHGEVWCVLNYRVVNCL